MVDVDLTHEDYLMLESWFLRLRAKKQDDTEKERFLYSKILVLHDARMREDIKFKEMMKG